MLRLYWEIENAGKAQAMSDPIYMYALAVQEGANPACGAGNIIGDFTPPLGLENCQLSDREINPGVTQAHRLTAWLLQQIAPTQRELMGLFIGTRYGSLEDDRLFQASRVADAGKFASPAAFRRTLPSTVSAELTIAFGLRGPLITFADHRTPSLLAIIRAANWIARGRLNAAVAGSLDFLSPHQLGSPDSQSVCRTVLCLLATREAFLELSPWAAMTLAEVCPTRASRLQAVTQSEETDFPAMAELTAAGKRSLRRIERDGGNGNTCRLEIQVL